MQRNRRMLREMHGPRTNPRTYAMYFRTWRPSHPCPAYITKAGMLKGAHRDAMNRLLHFALQFAELDWEKDSNRVLRIVLNGLDDACFRLWDSCYKEGNKETNAMLKHLKKGMSRSEPPAQLKPYLDSIAERRAAERAGQIVDPDPGVNEDVEHS